MFLMKISVDTLLVKGEGLWWRWRNSVPQSQLTALPSTFSFLLVVADLVVADHDGLLQVVLEASKLIWIIGCDSGLTMVIMSAASLDTSVPVMPMDTLQIINAMNVTVRIQLTKISLPSSTLFTMMAKSSSMMIMSAASASSWPRPSPAFNLSSLRITLKSREEASSCSQLPPSLPMC